MSRESSEGSSSVQASKTNLRRRRLILGLAVGSLALSSSANAQTYSVLYAFAGKPDGAFPNSLVANSGNLYGITHHGGLYDLGTLFKIDSAGTETVLTNFDIANGGGPASGLVLGSGYLYDTTNSGGYHGYGTVTQMKKKSGKSALRYSFCSLANCADGSFPQYGPTLDSAGNLYGTGQQGGAQNVGVIFKVDPTGKETVLYNFCPNGGVCADGEYPGSGAIEDSAGDLYGTAFGGPVNNASCSGSCGVVWKLDASGNESVLHAFAGPPNDGAFPGQSNLTIDSTGTLYGGTPSGGSHSCNCGTIFKIDASGNETVLYNFTGGNDGYGVTDTLVLDKKGNLYGETGGGAYGYGTVFELTKSGQFKTLYSFQGQSDGGYPQGALLLDKTGAIYGTSAWGGDMSCADNQGGGCGVVFKITP